MMGIKALLLSLGAKELQTLQTMIVPLSIVLAVLTLLFIIEYWMILNKANKPGWSILIPFYNVIVILQTAQRPLWWIILLLIPLVNIPFLLIIRYDLSKIFGKSTGFAIGFMILPFLFRPIIAFGKSKYESN